MAILFKYNIRNLWVYTGILYDGVPTSGDPNFGGWYYAITVLSGVQPSAATITSSWSSYNAAYLCHWDNVTLASSNLTTSGAAQGIGIWTPTSAVNANASGTASWAIMWPTNPNEATIQSSSLPSTRFIVVPVSDVAGTGVVRLTSTALTIGNPYTINDVVLIGGGGIA